MCGYDGINDKIAALKSQIHALKSQNEALTVKALKPIADSLLKDAEISGGHKIVRHIMNHSSQDEAKHLFRLITEDKEAVAVIACVNDEGVFMMIGTDRGNKAADVRQAFRRAIGILGGKGGGTPFSAQGWGKNAQAVNEAVDAAVNELKNE